MRAADAEGVLEALRACTPDALEPSPSVAVAWSGGADSTALLVLVIEALRLHMGLDEGERLPSPVVALHVDHGLRPDSAQDAAWCADRAAELGPDVALVTLALSERGALGAAPGSLEANARSARYAALGDALLRALGGPRVLLTAHHADDNLETLAMALLRGSGLPGLAGVRPRVALDLITQRPAHRAITVARPLLALPKATLVAALKRRGLGWREDPTNADTAHLRNAIRHTLTPRLMALADAPDPLWRAPLRLREDLELIRALAAARLTAASRPLPEGFAQGIALDRDALAAELPAMRGHIVRLALERDGLTQGVSPLPPDHATMARFVEAVEPPARGPDTVLHGRGVHATVTRRALVLHHPDPARWSAPLPEARALALDAPIAWGPHRTLRAAVHHGTDARRALLDALSAPGAARHLMLFDADAVALPLRVAPLGASNPRVARLGGTSKRLRRIASDARLPRVGRPHLPQVWDADGVLLGCPGLVRARHAPVSDATCRVLVVHHTDALAPAHGLNAASWRLGRRE